MTKEEKRSKYFKGWYEKNRDKVRDRRARQRAEGTDYYSRNKELISRRRKEKRRQMKELS